MKKKIILYVLALLWMPLSSNAADDFGNRFTGMTPAALSQPETANVQNIEPAAGEEQPGTEAPPAASEKPQQDESENSQKEAPENAVASDREEEKSD